MSYRIEYESKPDRKKEKTSHFGLIGVTIVITVWFLAFSWNMFWFLPEQAQKFREVFFPWSSAEVQTAVSNLKDDVRSGLSFQEAAQTFCLDLLNDDGE